MEKIKLAAVRSGGHIITGQNHAECLKTCSELSLPVPDYKLGQGFLTNKLRFVLRKEALLIAIKAGQIREKHSPKDQLLSEDLDYSD